MSRVYGLAIFLVLSGCDSRRFEVPTYRRQERRTRKKVEASDLPSWSTMSQPDETLAFRPEPVKLQGKTWFREGSSEVFAFYFRRKNHLAARHLFQISRQVAGFLSVWLKKPFSSRLHVVLMPVADPADKQFFSSEKMAVPRVAKAQYVIYTGTHHQPYLSKYGRVSELIELAARSLFPRSKVSPDFWRSELFPAYLAFRGMSAMLDKGYDRTAKPKFRKTLNAVGKPTFAELLRYWAYLREGKLQGPATQRGYQTAMALLAYLEDGVGRKTWARILRQAAKQKQFSFWGTLQRERGKSKAQIGASFLTFYFNHASLVKAK